MIIKPTPKNLYNSELDNLDSTIKEYKDKFTYVLNAFCDSQVNNKIFNDNFMYLMSVIDKIQNENDDYSEKEIKKDIDYLYNKLAKRYGGIKND